jgi:hypothetical protein
VSIEWKRVFVTLSMCNSHNCIIGNGKFFNAAKGKDVALHLSQTWHTLRAAA